MGPHKNLLVWQKSMELVKAVYQVTAQFPKDETYGLVCQMRRCVISIPSNIAEGYGRGSNTDLVRFLYIALGSANELDTQMEISKELSYIEDAEATLLETENCKVVKMLNSLIYKRTHDDTTPDNLTT